MVSNGKDSCPYSPIRGFDLNNDHDLPVLLKSQTSKPGYAVLSYSRLLPMIDPGTVPISGFLGVRIVRAARGT
jgi:hypothetical protein